MREAEPGDSQGIVDLAVAAGLFPPEERGVVETMLAAHFDPVSGSPDICLVDDREGISGVAYARPREATDRVWDLTMLAVASDARRTGAASRLVGGIEAILRDRHQRALTVETSGTPSFAAARAFYERCGFASVASVPDYWEDGDSLELYWKRL